MADFQAVMTGLNKYPNGPLRGCVNDVVVARQILKEVHNVPDHQMRTLVDHRATKDEILERLDWLIYQGKTFKNLLFWYSGHGAQYPDQQYNGDESDGMDEILCPIDFDWRGNWISDDDIFSIVNQKNPESRLIMVFDACHSGTVFKSGNPGMPKANAIPRSMPTPLDLQVRAPEFDARAVIPSDPPTNDDKLWNLNWDDTPLEIPKVKQSKLRELENTIIVSGCKDHQTSADARFGNRYQGALSYCLQRYLYTKPEMSVERLKQETTRYLKSFGFVQDPMFTVCENTDASQLIFT